jgi:hypothetical protein
VRHAGGPFAQNIPRDAEFDHNHPSGQLPGLLIFIMACGCWVGDATVTSRMRGAGYVIDDLIDSRANEGLITLEQRRAFLPVT